MLKTERLQAANLADIARAAEILRAGGTVAFPTETVYGLGANALDATAVEKIFVAKQRPHWDPLIVHLPDRAMLPLLAKDLWRQASELMERFWPGPLTLLLPRTAEVPDIVTAGRPLVGVRMPQHPVALELIRQAGVPVAAPSANTFGHTSPTTAQHVLDDLDGRIDAVLDGGACELGVESTVVGPYYDEDEDWEGVMLFRAGGVSTEALNEVLGWVEPYRPDASKLANPGSLPSPGIGMRHYAPDAHVVLVQPDERPGHPVEDSLVATIDEWTTEQSRIGVLLPDRWNASAADLRFAWGPWHEPALLAQRLYSGLRSLEAQGATTIVCPLPSAPGIAEAIRDRLHKAAK